MEVEINHDTIMSANDKVRARLIMVQLLQTDYGSHSFPIKLLQNTFDVPFLLNEWA